MEDIETNLNKEKQISQFVFLIFLLMGAFGHCKT